MVLTFGLVFVSSTNDFRLNWAYSVSMIKRKMSQSVLGFVVLLLFTQVQASGVKSSIFVYHRLATKNLEDMDRLLRAKIHASQKATTPEEQVAYLVEATQALFSRPNFDNLIEKLLPQLLFELKDKRLTQKVFSEFINEATAGIQDEGQTVSGEAQVTYLIGLENWLLEMQVYTEQEDVRKLFERVAQTQFKISDLAKKTASLHLPYTLKDPQKLAQHILKKTQKSSSKNKPSSRVYSEETSSGHNAEASP